MFGLFNESCWKMGMSSPSIAQQHRNYWSKRGHRKAAHGRLPAFQCDLLYDFVLSTLETHNEEKRVFIDWPDLEGQAKLKTEGRLVCLQDWYPGEANGPRKKQDRCCRSKRTRVEDQAQESVKRTIPSWQASTSTQSFQHSCVVLSSFFYYPS